MTDTKKGWNLKSLLFEEAPPQTAEPAKVTPVSQTTVQSSAPVFSNPVSFSTPGIIDEKFAALLSKAMEDANLPGLDYYEFKSALKTMEGISIPADAKYKAVFATFQASGIDTNKLVETAKHYLNVLDEEKMKFDEATSARVGEKVTAREQELSELRQQNELNSQEIVRLTEEINRANQTISTIQNEIGDSQQKISQTKNNFDATHSAFTNAIRTDIANIQSYLGGVNTNGK